MDLFIHVTFLIQCSQSFSVLICYDSYGVTPFIKFQKVKTAVLKWYYAKTEYQSN